MYVYKYAGVKLQVQYFLTLVTVGGEKLHVPASLPLEENSQYPVNK
jgi:hypothetical protein